MLPSKYSKGFIYEKLGEISLSNLKLSKMYMKIQNISEYSFFIQMFFLEYAN